MRRPRSLFLSSLTLSIGVVAAAAIVVARPKTMFFFTSRLVCIATANASTSSNDWIDGSMPASRASVASSSLMSSSVAAGSGSATTPRSSSVNCSSYSSWWPPETWNVILRDLPLHLDELVALLDEPAPLPRSRSWIA